MKNVTLMFLQMLQYSVRSVELARRFLISRFMPIYSLLREFPY
jgi:hypothetical protein